MEIWSMWLAAALLFVLIEVFTAGFAIMCFSIGAFAAMALAFFCDILWIQVLVFAIFTTISFMFIRPVALKYLGRKEGGDLKTGVDALIGRRARVSQAIAEGGYGRVSIDGDDWKAASYDNSFIEAGTSVEIVRLESVILIVKTL